MMDLFETTEINGMKLANRFVRSATMHMLPRRARQVPGSWVSMRMISYPG